MINSDKKSEEYKIILNLVVMHCFNYNSFINTIIINPLLYIPGVYFMLKYQTEIRYDPYTGVLNPYASNEYF